MLCYSFQQQPHRCLHLVSPLVCLRIYKVQQCQTFIECGNCRRGGPCIYGAELIPLDPTLNQASQFSPIVVVVLLEELTHLLVAARDRIELERDRHEPRHPVHRRGKLAGKCDQLVMNGHLVISFHKRLEPFEFLRKEELEKRSNDRILTFVVEIQPSFGKTCLFGNIIHAGLLKAQSRKHRDSRFQDLVLALFTHVGTWGHHHLQEWSRLPAQLTSALSWNDPQGGI